MGYAAIPLVRMHPALHRSRSWNSGNSVMMWTTSRHGNASVSGKAVFFFRLVDLLLTLFAAGAKKQALSSKCIGCKPEADLEFPRCYTAAETDHSDLIPSDRHVHWRRRRAHAIRHPALRSAVIR